MFGKVGSVGRGRSKVSLWASAMSRGCFQIQGPDQVALVLRRRAQERRGESCADDVEMPKSKVEWVAQKDLAR